MSAHIPRQNEPETFELWQAMWRYFIENEYLLHPTESSLPEELPNKFFTILPSTEVYAFFDDIKEGVKEILTFYGFLKRACKEFAFSPKAEWNYLGKTRERESYLRYLESYFWSHQDELAFLPNYQELVEFPWKFVNYCEVHDFQSPQLVSDFFSPDSQHFIVQLESILQGFELNPFFIFDPTGSLQWKISVSETVTIQGGIQAVEDVFLYRLSCSSLTEMVF